MTQEDFIAEALSFAAGQIVVISGPDLEKLYMLGFAVAAAIDGAEIHSPTIVMDAKALVLYPSDTQERNTCFEFLVLSSSDRVVLVINQFDRNDPIQNQTKSTMEIDVVYDLCTKKAVENIPDAISNTFLGAGVRNLFPFISKVYYYDNSTDIVFIKNQISIR